MRLACLCGAVGDEGGGGTGTEEMRESLLEARALFDELVGASAVRGDGGPGHGDRHGDRYGEGRNTRGPARHKKWHKEERTA